MPVIDSLAAEYADRVAFVAPAWKAGLEATAERAAELLPSGEVLWGLDGEEEIFSDYAIPYQPVTVLIGADKTIVDQWPGELAEPELRSRIEALIEDS